MVSFRMRLFLLLALLLRLAPTQVLAAHCAGEDSAVAAASHAHHDAPATDETESDCSHCPPSECAAQHGCTVAPATLAMTTTSAMHFAALISGAASRVPPPLHSQSPAPPVPPPVIHSA